MRVARLLLIAVGVLLACVVGERIGQADELTFESHVRPILKAHCFDCHGAEEELKGKLDLRLVRLMKRGGESGSAVEPGKPEASLLLQRIKAGEMPQGPAKVSAREIAVLEKWIAGGAKTAREEPAEIGKGLGITDEERAYWAFRPIVRPRVPSSDLKSQISNLKFQMSDFKLECRTPIDGFVLAKLDERGLSFGPEADKATLIKRAYFDLIGLPPSRDEVEEFVNDHEPDAYERLLDRLLASPHYGERWGRHWLDAAGYADSDGYTINDRDRPWAYKYRDWVIRALNDDKPIDEFIVEQLAGDEFLNGKFANLSPIDIDRLTATGFLRMVSDGTDDGSVDQDLAKNAVVADTLKMVSSSLLGLTVGCAQCHDHRYDPISQVDYYRLRAIFEPALNWKRWQGRLKTLYTDADRAASAAIEADVAKVAAEKNTKQTEYMAKALELELAKHPEELRGKLRDAYNTPTDKRTPEQQQLLKERPSVNISPGVLYQYLPKEADELTGFDKRMAEMRSKKPVEEYLHCLAEEDGEPPATHLFHRGDHRQPKEAVTAAMLEIATPPGQRVEFPVNDGSINSTGRRLAFAKHLISGRDPLLPRALANRLWLHHFGRGLVNTPGDFGQLGERPTHPELLDWLAAELLRGRVREGERGSNSNASSPPPPLAPSPPLSIKRQHRLLMTSTTYRQSAARRPELEAVDPSNQLFGRMSVRRLDAEVLRDRVLASSGSLQQAMFGKPVPVAEDFVGQVIVNDMSRRSVYVQQKRSKPETLMRAFDAPVMECNCDKRPTSTVATQSLMLMNNEFVLKQAGLLAERIRRESSPLSPRAESADESLRRLFPELDLPALNAALGESGLPLRPSDLWQIGYGEFDASTKRTKSFAKFPHWTGSQWQGGAVMPDPQIGWAFLYAAGGHTGNDQQHSPIRRWTAPLTGTVSITGSLHHPSENGDGVRSRVVSSRSGLAAEWIAEHKAVDANIAAIEVQLGDTLDFITDCRESVTSDSFSWSITIKLKAADGKEISWSADKSFPGPPPPSLANQIATAWQIAYHRPITPAEFAAVCGFFRQQFATLSASPTNTDAELQALADLCQAMLSSNEFLYVD
ncbi:MAG: PSD1 and planctomycete cytochrome C domain-containing protein [Planctomycetaceae bacterium]